PWLKQELTAILNSLPTPTAAVDPVALRALWDSWFAGLAAPPTLPDPLPPLRLLLVLDNRRGNRSPEFVAWLFQHGVIPLYTPLGGSWLNMAESIQRILKRRALAGLYPTHPDEIIAQLEATGRGWNRQPTPFVWGG